MRTVTFLLVTLAIWVAGCEDQPGVDAVEQVAQPASVAAPTIVASATAAEPAPTSPTSAATATGLPTRMPAESPSPTTVPSSPTPTVRPAPHFNVDQAPYMESDCSDKYPCKDDLAAWEERMRVPPGFEIRYFARLPGRPTSITLGPDGLLYASVLTGTIYTISQAGEVASYVSGFTVPTGLAFQPDTDRLYVSSRVIDNNFGGEAKVSYVERGEVTDIITGLPCCYVGMHGPNGIAFGPDGMGYVGVGGRADHGEILDGPNAGTQDALHPLEASILRFDPDGLLVESYARGFRNPYDIAWDADGQLYATDNARDGDRLEDNPPDELHLVLPGREHGYPWYECPDCFGIPEHVQLVPTLYEFVPHAAVAGITAYTHSHFPGYYNDLFVVLWSAFEGAQKVMRFGPDRSLASDFATGFAAPIDITVGPEGRLYVVDFATGIIFQISHAN